MPLKSVYLRTVVSQTLQVKIDDRRMQREIWPRFENERRDGVDRAYKGGIASSEAVMDLA